MHCICGVSWYHCRHCSGISSVDNFDKSSGDRGKDLADFVECCIEYFGPVDKSIGEVGGDGGVWFSYNVVMVRSTGLCEGHSPVRLVLRVYRC